MGGCYWVDRIYTLRDEVEYGTGADRWGEGRCRLAGVEWKV